MTRCALHIVLPSTSSQRVLRRAAANMITMRAFTSPMGFCTKFVYFVKLWSACPSCKARHDSLGGWCALMENTKAPLLFLASNTGLLPSHKGMCGVGKPLAPLPNQPAGSADAPLPWSLIDNGHHFMVQVGTWFSSLTGMSTIFQGAHHTL